MIFALTLTGAEAQYISQVLEFMPAPGQFTNTVPWGSPAASETIAGKRDGTMSLGAFGGYVIFRFEKAVENHPDNPFGVDFTIFGNPTADWSEPGVVRVMEDENSNDLPDDTWYELAGSDRWFSTTISNYRVTYRNPGGADLDVPWTDDRGDSGVVRSISAHTQPYYPLPDSFPGIPGDTYTLTGTLIKGYLDTATPPLIRSGRRAFGYADNRERGDARTFLPDNPYTSELEHSGGDAFDIRWAVDPSGQYVDLDSIHFIMVQTAMMGHGGWLGEVSTEITGAIDVSPDRSVQGETDLVVIRDLPQVIRVPEFQIEVFVLSRGRIQEGKEIRWEVEMEGGDETGQVPGARVDETNLLILERSGKLSLTASLVQDPSIRATVTAAVDLESTGYERTTAAGREVCLYPNPATGRIFIRLPGAGGGFEISVYDAAGKRCIRSFAVGAQTSLDVIELPAGIYFMEIRGERGNSRHRFIKQ